MKCCLHSLSFLPILSLFLSACTPPPPSPKTAVTLPLPESGSIRLQQGDHVLDFYSTNWKLEYIHPNGDRELISDAIRQEDNPELISQTDSSFQLVYAKSRLNLELTFTQNLEIALSIRSDSSQTVTWPKAPITKSKDYLIWPRNEGYYIPFSDSMFTKVFRNRSFRTMQLSLPFWAVEKESATTLYLIDNPFHNMAHFQEVGSHMFLSLEHEFAPNSSMAEAHKMVIAHLSNPSPVSSAIYFRERLIEAGKLKRLEKKMEEVPLLSKAIAAPWAHLIDPMFISTHDVLPGTWEEFLGQFSRDVQAGRGFVGERWSSLSKDDRNNFKEITQAKPLYAYHKKIFVRLLSALLNEDGMNSEFSTTRRTFAERLYQDYSSYLLPPAQWGGGISMRMIDALKTAGFEHMILQVSGHQSVYEKVEVAKHAMEQGYLLGIYDSYHSIHDPATFGTDNSWPTAQMEADLYQTVIKKKRDGKDYLGFAQKGGLVSPIAVRGYYESRISQNFQQVPYNYYFIDCDAFGEYQDDYHPDRKRSRQEDLAERLDRLTWLRKTYNIPIGSEKGIYLFSDYLDLNEGVTVPIMGFRDKDMKDPHSKYFKGRYWPPEMQEINFKEIPLKEKFIYRNLDPRFKIPLWEAVYHDCVIPTAHPSVPSLKFSNAKTDIALTEVFYQYPPVYNLNLEFFEAHKDRMLHQYTFYKKTHPETVKHAVTDFEFLTEDRWIQRIQFGEIAIIANYSLESYTYRGNKIPSKSVLYLHPAGKPELFSPEGYK